jgi:hypothetical protein
MNAIFYGSSESGATEADGISALIFKTFGIKKIKLNRFF